MHKDDYEVYQALECPKIRRVYAKSVMLRILGMAVTDVIHEGASPMMLKEKEI